MSRLMPPKRWFSENHRTRVSGCVPCCRLDCCYAAAGSRQAPCSGAIDTATASGRPFLPRSGFIQILPPGKPGTPPCKSGQLEKDLGSEVSSARHAARLIIFEIMRSFFVGFKCPSRSPSGFAIHCGERTEPSARSSSVLPHYFTLTSRAFDLAIGVVGRCTFSTPSWKSAVTFVLSASSGSVKLRRKLPKDRSMRWNFLF
jgi:hypothetical protein